MLRNGIVIAAHRPGFRISNTITRDRSIYDSYDAEIATAYKNVGAGEREALGQRVDQQEDATSVKDDHAAAYAAKDEYYRAAYRRDGQ